MNSLIEKMKCRLMDLWDVSHSNDYNAGIDAAMQAMEEIEAEHLVKRTIFKKVSEKDMKNVEGSTLPLYQPMEIIIKDWFGTRTIIASVYHVCKDECCKYHMVTIEGNIERIRETEIISTVQCCLTEPVRTPFVELSKLYATQIEEGRKYQELQQQLEDHILFESSKLETETRRKGKNKNVTRYEKVI